MRLPSLTALTLSARRDNHELFEDATTYRITVAQPLGQRVKLRASYGTGIANPTFFELFGFIPGSFDPNPNLKPEESRGFDVGADFADRETAVGFRSPTSMRIWKTKSPARSTQHVSLERREPERQEQAARLRSRSAIRAERQSDGVGRLHVYGREAVRRSDRSAPSAHISVRPRSPTRCRVRPVRSRSRSITTVGRRISIFEASPRRA